MTKCISCLNCKFIDEIKKLKSENKKLKEEVKDLEDLAEFKTQRIRELMGYA